MPKTLRSAAFAALLTPALLLADTPATTQWVVTSAKATGRNGEDYRSSLRIVNPNAAVAPVDLYFLPASGDGSGDNAGAPKVSVSVPAKSTLALDDVLATTFHTTGAGGIRIESPAPASQAVWVLSQTLVANALSATGKPGTNGFAIPAQTTDALVATGETAYVPYVSASTSGTSGYRTNLFLLSANGTANTVVTVTLQKGDGTVVGTPRDVTLARYGQTQLNDLGALFGYSANDTNLTAIVTVKSGGPVATGASVIDNAIASVSYSPPMKVAAASAAGNSGAFGLLLNDLYGFSGRLDVVGGTGDFVSMGIVIPACPSSPLLFNFQGFGPSYGTSTQNTSFTRNTDGTISFAGASTGATWNGTVYSKYDGSVYGTVTYTRATGAVTADNPCPGASVQYSFTGAKASSLQ